MLSYYDARIAFVVVHVYFHTVFNLVYIYTPNNHCRHSKYYVLEPLMCLPKIICVLS